MGGGCKNVSGGVPCHYKSLNDRFRRMFEAGRYAQALVAFERAGRSREARICNAYVLQEKAALISTTAGTARVQAFVTAAKAFLKGVLDSPSKERLTCYEAAGDCYKEARDLKRAADNYQLAEKYDKAALAYMERGCIDEMVEVINQHKRTFSSSVHEQLTTAAQTHYFKVHFNCPLVSRHL